MSGISALVNSVTNLWHSGEESNLAQNREILKIGNVLNSLFIDRKNIEIPRLVVVGSQSSGKSSLLNSILGMDILPTGNNMVTRAPLQLELIQSSGNTRAEFGKYHEGNWKSLDDFELDYPNITVEQKTRISTKIEMITRENAGDDMNISFVPIYLRIFSSNLPNLSLVDLPGLTMVACTDRGQPKDIKEQIRKMIGEYIQPSKTIILAIMPARIDIEADIALDLIKEYDPNGERTVGILTKLDLMNQETDITHLLENRVSVDLKLKHGYFGIKNRSKRETDEKNALEGLTLEANYFKNHKVYCQSKYRSHLGVPSVCKSLSNILIQSIKSCLPKILQEINENISQNREKLDKLGEPLPTDENAQSALVHHLLSRFCRKYVNVLEDRGNIINTGRNIKDVFVEFRENIGQLNPFEKGHCSEEYIRESIRNCEGNHMSFPSPPIEVLEQIMKDQHKKPIQKLYPIAKKCCENVMSEMILLTNILIDDIGIIRFPHFAKLVKNNLVNHINLDNLSSTLKKILELIESQENYIWTDDFQFIHILEKSGEDTGENIQIAMMRKLLQAYYKTVVTVLQDSIPKCIMLFMVKYSVNNLSSKLYDAVKKEKLGVLLKEYDDIHIQREQLEKSNRELVKAKELIESIV